MSRAFVKDDDDGPEPVIPRPVREHPYFVTPEGYRELEQRLAQAQAAEDAREVESLGERIEAAVVVDPRDQPAGTVAFGAKVTVEDPKGQKQTYRIVGEDEADPLQGTISWLSPLAQALLERQSGDRVVWERPAGNVPLTIVSIAY